jgi:nucleoside phosphorylase
LVSAANVAMKMAASFGKIRFGLMVGIGGGVPSEDDDVRLGDIIVSVPNGQHGGVVQYDLGRTGPGGSTRTGSLNSPPNALLTALTDLRAAQEMDELDLSDDLSRLAQQVPRFAMPSVTDTLFQATYQHQPSKTCTSCDSTMVVERAARDKNHPVIHYGTIASGNQVMKNATIRDELSRRLGGVLCFEMEAAGLMNDFPCLIVRGVSDYADTHKNDGWQRYAAATAAVFAKKLLGHLAAVAVAQSRTINETMGQILERVAASHNVVQQVYSSLDSRS